MASMARVKALAVTGVLALSICSAGGVEALTQIVALPTDIAPSDNRSMAPRPSFPGANLAAWKTYPRLYEAFDRDHFFLRNRLIRAYNRFHLEVLRVTPARQHPLQGLHGWLFLPQLYKCLDTYRPQPPNLTQLTAWRDVHVQRHIFLAAHGIDYVVMPLPDKPSLYPEYLPPFYAASWQQHSRRRQLLAALQAEPLVQVVNVAPAMCAAKARLPVYRQTDSHWNNFGAWVAAQALTQHLAGRHPNMALPTPSAYRCSLYSTYQTGDLALMLALPQKLTEPQVAIDCPIPGSIILKPVLTQRNGQSVGPEATVDNLFGFFTMVGGNPKSGHMLVRHDSFGEAILPYLLGAVKTLTYDDSTLEFNVDRVFAAQPQVVVDMHVERLLGFKALPNPEEVTTLWRRQRQFAWLTPLWEAPAAALSSAKVVTLPPSPGPQGLLRLRLQASGKTTVELYTARPPAAPKPLRASLRRQSIALRAGTNLVYLRPPPQSEGQALCLAVRHPGETVRLLEATARSPAPGELCDAATPLVESSAAQVGGKDATRRLPHVVTSALP
jgi:alginate O-acetyltransferase complex protein AlgJ